MIDLSQRYWLFIYPRWGSKGGLNDLHTTHDDLRSAGDEISWFHRHKGETLYHVLDIKGGKIIEKDRLLPLSDHIKNLK